jgi:hypothetical protein
VSDGLGQRRRLVQAGAAVEANRIAWWAFWGSAAQGIFGFVAAAAAGVAAVAAVKAANIAARAAKEWQATLAHQAGNDCVRAAREFASAADKFREAVTVYPWNWLSINQMFTEMENAWLRFTTNHAGGTTRSVKMLMFHGKTLSVPTRTR